MDVCRQSIVFDTAAAIAACLGAIGEDDDVILERVKNRMDPEAEFRVLGGYRDVALNLRIDTVETRAMGVETHVCEVQLLLRCFDTIKVRRRRVFLQCHVWVVCLEVPFSLRGQVSWASLELLRRFSMHTCRSVVHVHSSNTTYTRGSVRDT